jgi:hypothetical protein
VIVTTEVDDEGEDNFRNSSITDYDEDLDVSFSKFGAGLGNRKLKDQLSMVRGSTIACPYSGFWRTCLSRACVYSVYTNTVLILFFPGQSREYC